MREAIREALLADPGVFLMGEDVGRYGGCYAVTKGLLDEFGPERIRDTPLSELAFVGAGIGAALGGMRPIVEIMTVNFSLLALDQIVNNAATIRHMSGGQFEVPVVIRMATGAGRQLAAQHSHSLEGWYAHIPGLKVLTPATLEDARFMLAAALADPNPVLIFEHVMLYNRSGVLSSNGPVDIRNAIVRRPGKDVTLVTYGGTLFKTLDAAETLAKEGVEAEVIDLRVLRPLDAETVLASVRKTRRAVIVDEGWRSGSLSAEISARIMEGAFWELDAPVGRVCSAEVPIPYPHHLEEAALPQPDGDRRRGQGGPRRLMGEFRMPSLGADMEAGTLVEWLKRPGDRVRRGDIVAVVETQKGAIEIDIFEDGVIERWLVEPGTTVPVGTPLALIAGAQPAAAVKVAEVPASTGGTGACSATACRTSACGGAREGITRRAPVGEPNVGSRLSGLSGSGPSGAILYADVERAAAGAASRQAAAEAPRPRRDAPCNRRGDGALEARDPALLSEHDRRPHPTLSPGSRRPTQLARRRNGCCSRHCCSRPSRAPSARPLSSTGSLPPKGFSPAPASISVRRSRSAAAASSHRLFATRTSFRSTS